MKFEHVELYIRKSTPKEPTSLSTMYRQKLKISTLEADLRQDQDRKPIPELTVYC